MHPIHREQSRYGQLIKTDHKDEELTMVKVRSKSLHPLQPTIDVNRRQLPMEVDSGAAVSVISTTTQVERFPKFPLNKTSASAILMTNTGEPIPVVGEMEVGVSYGE